MKIVRVFYKGDDYFEAYLHCEFCGNDEIARRYESEEEFIDNILPSVRCSRCGKSAE